MQAGRDLAIVDPPKRARILTSDADRMNSLFREASIVDHERLEPWQLSLQHQCEPAQHLGISPSALGNAPQQALPHRLYVCVRVDEPCRFAARSLAGLAGRAQDHGGGFKPQTRSCARAGGPFSAAQRGS